MSGYPSSGIEEQLHRQNAQLKALAVLSQMLAEAETDIQRVLDAITVNVAELVGDTCTLALLSEDRQLLNAVAYHHPDPQAMPLLREMTKTPYRAGESSHWQVMQTGRSLLLENLSQEELRSTARPDFLPYLDHFGIYDVLIVPLRVQSKSIGTIAVSRDRPGISYSESDQAFLQELADRAALAIYNAQLFQVLQDELAERKRMEVELAELQRLLLDGVDLERIRLAKSIHDDAVQGLYGVLFTLERISTSNVDEQISSLLVSSKSEIKHVINLFRDLYRELRPPTLVPFGLDTAIASHADLLQQENPDLNVRLELSHDVIDLPEQVAYTLFRSYQQAMSNVLNHAAAQQVTVRLWLEGEQVFLEVEDDGRGFSVPGSWIGMLRTGRYGLARFAERAQAIGGKLDVDSKPGRGTRVWIRIPLTSI